MLRGTGGHRWGTEGPWGCYGGHCRLALLSRSGVGGPFLIQTSWQRCWIPHPDLTAWDPASRSLTLGTTHS